MTNSIGKYKRVGLANTFTAHYSSVRIMARFLEEMGHNVIKSPRTTPEMLEAGTTFASADFCISLRLYVGHCYSLLKNHPDLDFILAPNVCRENSISSACAKYRDPGGAALRSLGGSLAYVWGKASHKRLPQLAGDNQPVFGAWPSLLQPNIWSLDYIPMRNLCFRLACDLDTIAGDKLKLVAGSFLPDFLKKNVFPFYKQMEAAFERAYRAELTEDDAVYERFRQTKDRPRVAIVGRQYLLKDPLITADLVGYFKRTTAVLTPYDVPFNILAEGYRSVTGYYDTHRLFTAFADAIAPQADGFVLINSFGCHPDAFTMEVLLEDLRSRGIPAWLFKYDEQSSNTGFQTRYETVRVFLEREWQKKERFKPQAATAPGGCLSPSVPAVPRRPLITWPYMNEIVNLMIEELFFQAGLSSYAVSPEPTNAYTLEIGDDRHREACCPFALTTGSLRQTLEKCLRDFEERRADPCRILFLQGRQDGPCAFGWYSLAQAREVPFPYQERLLAGNHTVEMFSLGPGDAKEFVEQLARLGDGKRLQGIRKYFLEREKAAGLKRIWGRSRLISTVKSLTRTVALGMNRAEDLRAQALILRAHELRPGDTALAYKRGIDLLRSEHSPKGLRQAYRQAVKLLEQVPRDDLPRPRVVIVGEIYVALSSFANRGAIENLLGRAGIEVVEGVTISSFLNHTLRETYRRLRVNLPIVNSFLVFWAHHHVYLSQQKIREKKARPFLRYEVGGEGVVSVAKAREALEKGVDGIVHVYPFKCMPEGIAKDALMELSRFYGVPHLSLTFGKEVEIERLKTELRTFAALLHDQLGSQLREKTLLQIRAEQAVRAKQLGRLLDRVYAGMNKYATDDLGYTGFQF